MKNRNRQPLANASTPAPETTGPETPATAETPGDANASTPVDVTPGDANASTPTTGPETPGDASTQPPAADEELGITVLGQRLAMSPGQAIAHLTAPENVSRLGVEIAARLAIASSDIDVEAIKAAGTPAQILAALENELAVRATAKREIDGISLAVQGKADYVRATALGLIAESRDAFFGPDKPHKSLTAWAAANSFKLGLQSASWVTRLVAIAADPDAMWLIEHYGSTAARELTVSTPAELSAMAKKWRGLLTSRLGLPLSISAAAAVRVWEKTLLPTPTPGTIDGTARHVDDNAQPPAAGQPPASTQPPAETPGNANANAQPPAAGTPASTPEANASTPEANNAPVGGTPDVDYRNFNAASWQNVSDKLKHEMFASLTPGWCDTANMQSAAIGLMRKYRDNVWTDNRDANKAATAVRELREIATAILNATAEPQPPARVETPARPPAAVRPNMTPTASGLRAEMVPTASLPVDASTPATAETPAAGPETGPETPTTMVSTPVQAPVETPAA